jgi:septal ring factor EnvC (AmiA/AmiB activator)
VQWGFAARKVPGVLGKEEPPSYEVLAALVASLRRELAEAAAALEQARAELAQARERIAELEARLKQNPLLTEQGPVFPQLDRLAMALGCTVTARG